MGRPKATVQIGGRTFLDRVLGVAGPVFEDIVLVDRPGGTAGLAGARTIRESPHAGSGAIFGVERAMEDAADGRLWILAIDYPLLTPEILADLRSRYDRTRAGLLVPFWNDRPQMLCAGYDAALLGRVREALSRGEHRLRGLLAESSAEIVSEQELRRDHAGEPLLNVNDPADLERARRIDEEAHAPRH